MNKSLRVTPWAQGQSLHDSHAQRVLMFSRWEMSHHLIFTPAVDSSNPPITGFGWQWLNIPSDQGHTHKRYPLTKGAVLKGQSAQRLRLPDQTYPQLEAIKWEFFLMISQNHFTLCLSTWSPYRLSSWGRWGSLGCVLWVFITTGMHYSHSVAFYLKIPFKRLGSIIFKFNF